MAINPRDKSRANGLPDDAVRRALESSGLFETAWFVDRNPDLAASKLDPLLHYHLFGWREGRWPNPYFDPAWYLAQNPDVRAAGMDPLLHYALYGEREGRQPISHFDPAWYRLMHALPTPVLALAHFLRHRTGGHVSPIPEFDAVYYLAHAPDVASAGMDPFEHYIIRGASEGRLPSPQFDPAYYRVRHLSHAPQENPLLHYRAHRGRPELHPKRPAGETDIPQEVRRHTSPGPLFEEAEPLPQAAPRRAKVLAFYLPQFHAVPENDGWWGRGFTEWTNVARALPRFAGHYQPRIPRDLGHYRLEGTETLRRQAKMAQDAGIHGFVFYFYWFNRRRLLDGPLEALLADPTVDLPFCLMWANENWTRRWDGSEQEVLISQDYRDEDGPALVAEFVRHFRDPRYIRLEGRPVLMVYRAGLIPRTQDSVAAWRAQFRAMGEDPLFIMAQSFDERDPRPYGMDAAVEFPPHKLTVGLERLNPSLQMLDASARPDVFEYEAVARATDLAPPPFPLIRTAVPGWDNDARRQGAGMVLHRSTPGAFGAWLDRLIGAAVAQPVGGEALVCINAWNEWAEGAYLEPDVHFGAAYLNAAARAIGAAVVPVRRVLLVGHDAFPAGAQLLLLHIARQMQAQGVPIEIVLLDGGALEPEYRAAGPLTILSLAALAQGAWPSAGAGFVGALVNTAAAAAAIPYLAQAGIACTWLVHELPRLLMERDLLDPARAAAGLARHVVFAAPFVRDRFAEHIPLDAASVSILPQGLYAPPRPGRSRTALRAALGVPDDAVLAVALGYADLRKGFDLFVEAWRHGRGVHFLWIGDMDPVVRAYLLPAHAPGLHILPWDAQATEWFAAADVHLLTSREDAFPSVVLEAMACGLPTVAFEGAGGAPALLRAYGAGRVVPAGDTRALVAALVAGAGPVKGLAERTRRDFDWSVYVDRLLGLVWPDRRRISAVVPNFNYARYLPARLASIATQTRGVDEVIVLDDASTDGSEAVVRECWPGVRWVGQAENSGSVFRQWRRAAALAQSEWLWIAEADDVAEPGLLEALDQALNQAPDQAPDHAVLAFSDSRAIDEGGETLWPDHQAYYAEAGASVLQRDGVIPAAQFLRSCLATRNLILNASAVLFRRDALLRALDRCGPGLDDWAMAGDWRLYAEMLAEGGSVAYVARPLNLHRRHQTSVTGRIESDRHLNEMAAMHQRMRVILGDTDGLRQSQMAALREARTALMPAPTVLTPTPAPARRVRSRRGLPLKGQRS